MFASVPLRVLPLTVTALALPTSLLANAPLTVPPSATASLPKAVTLAVPVKAAAVLAS